MSAILQVMVVFHVAAAAYWFGAAAGQPRRLRALLDLSPGDAKKLAPGMRKEGVLIGLAAILVLLTGVGLIFLVGGFGAVHPRIHTSLLLAVVWVGVGAGVVRPNAMAIVDAAASGSPLEPLRSKVKRVGMGTGIGHLLFIIMLTLMLWRMP